MREIKFRAWDKVHECYLYDVQYAYDTLSGWVKYEDGENADYDEDCFGGFLDNEQYIVEQYTGLQDKNGRKIYEGDVVRNPYKYAQPHVSQIFVEGGNTYLSGENLATGDDMLLCDYANQCEVIGNVHDKEEDTNKE